MVTSSLALKGSFLDLDAAPSCFSLLPHFDESYAVPIDKDPLVVPDGPITRSRAKKIKEAMVGLVQSTWDELAYSPSKASTFKMGFKEEEPALIHMIQAKEELA